MENISKNSNHFDKIKIKINSNFENKFLSIKRKKFQKSSSEKIEQANSEVIEVINLEDEKNIVENPYISKLNNLRCNLIPRFLHKYGFNAVSNQIDKWKSSLLYKKYLLPTNNVSLNNGKEHEGKHITDKKRNVAQKISKHTYQLSLCSDGDEYKDLCSNVIIDLSSESEPEKSLSNKKQKCKNTFGNPLSNQLSRAKIEVMKIFDEPNTVEIEWVNDVDSESFPNWNFIYRNFTFEKNISLFIEESKRDNVCCQCTGRCQNIKKCKCSYLNYYLSGKFSYTYLPVKSTNPGLVNECHKTLISSWQSCYHVYECSKQCECNEAKCSLTLSKMIKPEFHLPMLKERFLLRRINKQITRKGKVFGRIMWGLLTKVNIPKNSYVIEYTGEIISNKEGNIRGYHYDSESLSYLFDICSDVDQYYFSLYNLYLRNILGSPFRRFQSELTEDDFPLVIDAKEYGSLARFINHSCNPNLRSVNVHVDTQHPRYAQICFFSIVDIPAGTELTIDYHYSMVDEAEDVYCLCGERECRIFLYKGK